MEAYHDFCRIVKSCNVEKVKEILFGKSPVTIKNLNLQDEDGFTPLCYACMKLGKLEMIRMLIASGASVDEKSSDDETPLYMATYNKHYDIAAELLTAGAKVDLTNGPERETPLHCAARLGLVDFMTLFLDHKANINARTALSQTPLYLATASKKLEAVYILLTKGADQTVTDLDGKNPLYVAGEKELKEIAALLKAPKEKLHFAKADVDRALSSQRPSLTSMEDIAFKLEQKKKEEDAIKALVKPKAPTNAPAVTVIGATTKSTSKTTSTTAAVVTKAPHSTAKTTTTTTTSKTSTTTAPKPSVSANSTTTKKTVPEPETKQKAATSTTTATQKSNAEDVLAQDKLFGTPIRTLEECFRLGLVDTTPTGPKVPRAKGPRLGGTSMAPGSGTDVSVRSKEPLVSIIGDNLDFSSLSVKERRSSV